MKEHREDCVKDLCDPPHCTCPLPQEPRESWTEKLNDIYPHQSPLCTSTRCRGGCVQDEIRELVDGLLSSTQASMREEVIREIRKDIINKGLGLGTVAHGKNTSKEYMTGAADQFCEDERRIIAYLSRILGDKKV